MSPSNQNMDFWDLPVLSLKKIQKISWSWDNNGRKISMHKKNWNKKTKNDVTNNPYVGI